HRRQPQLLVLARDSLERAPAVHLVRRVVAGPLEVDEADRSPGLPRDPDERGGIRPCRDVLEAGLEPGHDVVAEVDGHDRRHEVDALLTRTVELPDRELLAARDPVQVRVLEPDGPDAFEIHQRAVTRTGIRLNAFVKFERIRSAGPVSSTSATRGSSSSNITCTSSLARCAPRQ